MDIFVMVCSIVIAVALTIGFIKDFKDRKSKKVNSNEETRQD